MIWCISYSLKIINNFQLIRNRLYDLFSIPTGERKNSKLDPKLFKIIEFETFLHHSNIKYHNKRKALINKLSSELAFASITEVEAFFLPYFSHDAFELNKTEYFISLKKN